MVVSYKKLNPEAKEPTRAHETDAGLDIYASGKGVYNAELGYIEYPTGLAIEIPEGFVGFIFPRSSISKTDFALANAVGVIDAGYRGEIKLRFKIYGNSKWQEIENRYSPGDRIGQLIIMPFPKVELLELDELSPSPRDQSGFGSSGA